MVGERRKRLNEPEIRQFTSLLESLSLVQDAHSIADHVNNVLPLARKHGLSAYDAAYPELSIRRNAPLATLDVRLQNAAKLAGVTIFEGATAK